MAAVAVRSVAPATRWWTRPFAIFGTDLPPNLALMAKLIVLALLLQPHLPLSNHFLPFFRFFDRVGSPAVFHGVLMLTFVLGSAALFLNRRSRSASLVLGLTILISILASRPTFSNNLAYCGALLLLIGLQPSDREPWLLRLQVVLLYFGAGLNKLLDPDWRRGQFFEYWFGHVHSHTWYLHIASRMPPFLASRLMSWASISTELGLSVMLLLRRLYPLAIWVGLAFHTSMLVLANTTFHMYYFAACASYLAFVSWPQEPVRVLYDRDCSFCVKVKHFYEHIDLERRCRWTSWPRAVNAEWLAARSSRSRIRLTIGEKEYAGFAALKMLLLYNPLTYFALVVVLRAPDLLDQRRWIAAFVLLLFSPLAEPLGNRVFSRLACARVASDLLLTTRETFSRP